MHTSAGQVQNLDLLDIGKVRTGQRQGSGTTVHANHIRFRPTNDRRITRQRSLIRIDKYVAPRTTHQAVRTRTTGDRVGICTTGDRVSLVRARQHVRTTVANDIDRLAQRRRNDRVRTRATRDRQARCGRRCVGAQRQAVGAIA